jgi:hypothetical protein
MDIDFAVLIIFIMGLLKAKALMIAYLHLRELFSVHN